MHILILVTSQRCRLSEISNQVYSLKSKLFFYAAIKTTRPNVIGPSSHVTKQTLQFDWMI